jgi:hypothetical protein
MRIHLYKWRVQYLLGLFILLPFLFMLLQGKVIYWGTASLQFIPWSSFTIDSLLSGGIPLWNPFNGLGAPFIANYQTAVFYPLNWLLFPCYIFWGVRGLAFGFTFLVAVHLLIAAIGFSFLLRSMGRTPASQFMGSFCWVFGGYIISRVSFLSMVWAFAWVSWILLFILKLRVSPQNKQVKNYLWLTAFLCLQLLCGHAQTVAYTAGLSLLVLFIPFERGLKRNILKFARYAVSLLFAVCLAAVQLLPTLEYLLQSQRSSQVGYDYATNYSFWPLRIVSLLFGNFWGNPGLNRFLAGGTFWEDQIYHGVFPFVLILLLFIPFVRKGERKVFWEKEGKTLLFYMVLALFAFFMSLGKNSFLYPFFYQYIPGIRLFQGPSRFLLIFTFSFCILLAFGFDYWQGKRFNPRKAGLLMAASFAAIIASVCVYRWGSTFPIQIYTSIWFSCALLLIFSLLTILKTRLGEKHNFAINLAFVSLLMADLIFVNFPYGHFVESDFYETDSDNQAEAGLDLTVFLDPDTETFLKYNKLFRFDRFQALDETANQFPSYLPDGNLVNPRYRMLNNFDPFVPQRYFDFMSWIDGLSHADQNLFLSLIGVNERADLDISLANGLSYEKLQASPIVQWYTCMATAPADQILDEILAELKSGLETRCLYVEEETLASSATITEMDAAPDIKYQLQQNGDIEISYTSNSDGWIVVRQMWYPGWKTVIDRSSEVKSIRADYLFIGVEVPHGSHTISISYDPLWYRVGVMVSAASLLLFAAVVTTCSVMRKNKSDSLGDLNGHNNK